VRSINAPPDVGDVDLTDSFDAKEVVVAGEEPPYAVEATNDRIPARGVLPRLPVSASTSTFSTFARSSSTDSRSTERTPRSTCDSHDSDRPTSPANAA
jgi:hypothetical protein